MASPKLAQIGGHCISGDGIITIKYLGPDRYASTVTPPNGQDWYQTSTLEGWHDWDTWSIEGWDGYDPEFVQGAEPFPFAEFGFVQVQTQAGTNNNSTACCNYPSSGSGSIHGTVVGIGEYSPQVGGVNFGGQGKYIIENINQPLVSLIDTGRDDTTVYVGRGNPDGAFSITNIPDGDYVLSFWDEDQAYLLTQANVSIQGGQALDMGNLDVAAWHSQVYGKVCNDTNRNGKCDTGEAGIPGLALNLLDRDNKVAFYGDNTATTDSNGNYRFPRTYPLGQWVVTQGYWEQFYTVGVTYQTENQPTETTVMANGGFVDVSSFNLIGHQTRMDWAVHAYEAPNHPELGPAIGGIVGEVLATTTRNELDARFAAAESYEPGLPDATVHMYWPVQCDAATGLPTHPSEPYQVPAAGTHCTLATTAFGSAYYLTDADTGAFIHGPEAQDPYTSETGSDRPTASPAALAAPVVEQVLPPATKRP
ncbi:MAG: SdrD B-like domain-containing protein [Caldilineaceae bacterium]